MSSQNGLNNMVVDNDFTVTNTECGGDALISVENLCTDPNSHAVVEVIANSSGGDAFIGYRIDGVQEWTQGIDNSVISPATDPFVLSASANLGTTNVITAQTSGELNYPLQPAFLAVKGTAQNNVTGTSSVPVTVTYTTEIFDQNNDYDGTSTFTAPVTGRYIFYYIVSLAELEAGANDVRATFSSSNRTYFPFFANGGGMRTGAADTSPDFLNISAACIVDMDLGDTIIVQAAVKGNAGATVDFRNTASEYFGGALMC